MQKLPLMRTGKNHTSVILHADEVVRIDRLGEKKYAIHTAEQVYEIDYSIESLEEWLFEEGFRQLDCNNLVNVNHIRHFDERKGIVYLGDPGHQQAKTASVARIQTEHVRKIMSLLRQQSGPITEDSALPSSCSVNNEVDESDPFLRSYTVLEAVNQRKKYEEKIRYLAFHDTVTDLPNRFKFKQALESEIETASGSGSTGAVIFIDLDRFKFINDTLGHAAGDQLLRLVAERLQGYGTDHVTARFGGDEFMILHPSCDSKQRIDAFIQGLWELFNQPFQFEGQDFYVSASIGVSLFPEHGVDSDSLIQYADTAMFRSKEKGGNQTEWFINEMNASFRRRLQMENDMRRAIEKGEFMLEYQPLVDIESGKITGMEALVRWNHPELGKVPPLEFIPLAEETGMIVPLGFWVLHEACRQTAEWHRRGFSELTVSVNISAKQFQQPGFLGSISSVLEETGLSARSLCVELTESVAMSQAQVMMDLMTELKKLGIQIAIDDFGTGYSSLAYLKRFRVHAIKFDRSFIKDITVDADDAAIIEAMIAMSKQLNIRTVAEGVETEEQLNYLRNNGCGDMQGYLFSRPVNSELFWDLLVRHRGLTSHGQT